MAQIPNHHFNRLEAIKNTHTMTPSPIVVCGLPRCGSSLTLQMLSAAGIRCNGLYPSFEVDDTDEDCAIEPASLQLPEPGETYSANFVKKWRDGAFKLLDPHRIELPKGFKYRFIFLTRSRRQQAYSQFKMMRLLGIIDGHLTQEDINHLRQDLAIDQKIGFQEISKHEGSILKVRFEDLISHPEMTADRLRWFLGLPIESVPIMAACVRPRSVTVYPGMLEIELMKEAQKTQDTHEA